MHLFDIHKEKEILMVTRERELERRTEIRQMVRYALFKSNHGVTLGFYTNKEYRASP